MTFDPLEEPIGPRSSALGREGNRDGVGERPERGARKRGRKGHTMYRSSWRNCTDDAKMGGICLEKKKKTATTVQGLCFYIYNPTRQAELKEGYLRRRHLRNKLWVPHSLLFCTVVAPWLLQSQHTAAASALPARKGLFPAALLHVQGFSCAVGLEPAEGLGDPLPSDTL